MASIDLDARRAARTEQENTPHTATLGGKEYAFKPRMPLEFTDLLTAGRMADAMKLLLVDPKDWERMRTSEPDDEDLVGIAGLYGVDLGESEASAPSSRRTGPTSKPTSPTTTGSGSPRPPKARIR